MNRRAFTLSLLSSIALTACNSSGRVGDSINPFANLTRRFRTNYGAISDGDFQLKRIPVNKIDKNFLRQIVDYETDERPGTIIVDVPSRYLYLVQSNGRALRYGVGVGRQGFSWSGKAIIGWKRKWPGWTPTQNMIKRSPELKKWAGGMPPGPLNPLGPRALYLVKNGRDTLYRLHGTPEWWSIGKAVSSGCIRLLNHDIIDLYDRVMPGAKIIVRQA